MNRAPDRREFLWSLGGGLGGVALAHLLGSQGLLAGTAERSRPRPDLDGGLHHRAQARRVVQLFMSGAASQCDTFDYKPQLQKDHDRPNAGRKLLGSPWAFRPRGECGKMVSELFEHVGGVVDDMCFLHTVHGDSAGAVVPLTSTT